VSAAYKSLELIFYLQILGIVEINVSHCTSSRCGRGDRSIAPVIVSFGTRCT